MGPYLAAAQEALKQAAEELRATYPLQKVRFGCVCYRDVNPLALPPPGSKRTAPLPVVSHPLTDDEETVAEFLGGIEAKGGLDVPEDLFAGIDEAVRLDWQATTRLLCVVTDAPCHGSRFHDLPEGEDSFPDEPDPHGLSAEKVLRPRPRTSAWSSAAPRRAVDGERQGAGAARARGGRGGDGGDDDDAASDAAPPPTTGFGASTDKMVAEFAALRGARGGRRRERLRTGRCRHRPACLDDEEDDDDDDDKSEQQSDDTKERERKAIAKANP